MKMSLILFLRNGFMAMEEIMKLMKFISYLTESINNNLHLFVFLNILYYYINRGRGVGLLEVKHLFSQYLDIVISDADI